MSWLVHSAVFGLFTAMGELLLPCDIRMAILQFLQGLSRKVLKNKALLQRISQLIENFPIKNRARWVQFGHLRHSQQSISFLEFHRIGGKFPAARL
jgi:hypothetical protein